MADNFQNNDPLYLPLSQSGLAPYVFAGGDHPVEEVSKGFMQAGAGFEYRFSPYAGLFVDARRAQPNQTKYFGVAGLGLRFAF